MSKKNWIYIGFFTALVITFYFVLTALVPEFGKRIPPISYVRPFAFTNQDGRIITNKDVAGKVYVSEYFFTTCTGICPRMNNNMKLVYEKYKGENDFLILSHTCDPETDSAARLKHYADSMKVDTHKWVFLTGRKDSLYKTARNSYLLDDPQNNLQNINEQFLHTQFFALVDRSGKVRKIYDGLKKDEIEELKKDIKRLLKEHNPGDRFSNNMFGS